MQYFDSLPKIIFTDQNGHSTLRTNILARASVIPETLKDPLLYYEYDIQEGDTPEIIAHKYYNDMYRYWIVLFANEILDPQWSWPLNSNQFNTYLLDKYGTQNIYSSIHHYEKVITQYDSGSQTTTVNTLQIDQETYNSLMETVNTYSLHSGQVTVTITKKIVSIYEYELSKNEQKRTISILNSKYVDEIETELLKLMNS